jgi:hypothetical protein
MPEQVPDIGPTVHRFFLFIGIALWAFYFVLIALSQILPLGLAALGTGCVLGTIMTGAGLWTSIRVRRPILYVAVIVLLPLSILCWWQLVVGATPGKQ